MPATCPHGNEIPGVPSPPRHLVNLAELTQGLRAPISRVSEVAEHEAPQLLSLLDQEGLRLGVDVEVIRSTGSEAVTVLRGTDRTALGLGAAQAVWVDVSRQDPAAARRDPGAP